jgi:hypothetical protein
VAHSREERRRAARASPRRDHDRVAAVVLHVLVSCGPGTLTAAQVALACERDPGLSADREVIGQALRELVEDGLAYRRGALFGATRAALRAFELGF